MRYRSLLICSLLVVVCNFIIVPTQPQPVAAQNTSNFSIFLPLVVNESHGQSPTEAAPSSYDKIRAALANKTIDLDSAARFSTYAAFGDSRVPADFKGDDSDDLSANLALRWVKQEWSKLKAETQQELQAFFEPPTASESWHAQSQMGPAGAVQVQGDEPIVWRSISDANKPVKVWYQERYGATDKSNAQIIFDLANDKAWPKLKELFQLEPPSDVLKKNNGGDGRYDIYLVAKLTRTVSYEKCEDTPSYVLLNHSDLDEANVATQLAFAFLYSYDLAESCSEYDWISTATAVWANDHIFAKNQYEHKVASRYLDKTEVSLNSQENSKALAGRYLWPFYLARQLGNPDLVRQIWERNEQFNSLAAINGVIPDGWQKHWPAFALNNWNQLPVDAYYQQDNLTSSAKATADQTIGLVDGKAVELIKEVNLAPLSSKYYRYRFAGGMSSVSFYNGWNYKLNKDVNGGYSFDELTNNEAKDIKVQALVKAGGSWQPAQDWSERPLSFFCLDGAADKIEELVLVVSNSQWEDRTKEFKPLGEAPMLTASNVGCYRWEGTIKHTRNSAYKEFPGFSHIEITANIVWQAIPEGPIDPNQVVWLPYSFQPASGTIQFKESYERYVEGTDGPVLDCGGAATGSQAVTESAGALHLTPVIYPHLPSSQRAIAGHLYTYMDIITPPCEDSNEENMFVNVWDLGEDILFTVDADGRRIKGAYSPEAVCDEWETCDERYEWEFVMRTK